MAISISALLRGLPRELAEALSTIVDRVEATYSQTINEDDARIAVITIRKAAQKLGVELPNPPQSADNWEAMYNFYSRRVRMIADEHKESTISNSVDAELDRILSEREGEPGFAVLTPDEKSAIMQRIETIRRLIDESGLLSRKKNALLGKLSDFAKEVTRDGTRTDALFAFLGELAFTAGVMAKNAKPAIDEAKEITKIVVGSRATREGISLPSPEKILRLPAMDE